MVWVFIGVVDGLSADKQTGRQTLWPQIPLILVGVSKYFATKLYFECVFVFRVTSLTINM